MPIQNPKSKIQNLKSIGLALAIAGCLNFMGVNPAMAQPQNPRSLTVTGQGITRIATTLTQVQLGVEVQGKNAAEVQQEVARRSSAVVDFLRSRNVERLQTAGINLQPNYDYNNRERRLIGYIGTNTVSFSLKTEAVGALLDEAVNKGATRIDGVSFTATDEAIAGAQKDALRQATEDAQQQAGTVLKTLNFSPKDIVSIQINGAAPPQPRLMRAEAMRAADAAPPPTPVIGGEQEVRASVTLEISY
jgi:uncharacterized protein YggE